MKLKHLIGNCLAICGLLTGCLSEPDFEPVVEGTDTCLEVQLYNEIRQQPATRVNDEGFCNGDAVGIYVVNYVDGVQGSLKADDNQADNVKYTLDESTGAWTPETPVYYLDKKTKVDIYGYYPYATPTEIETYPFELAKDQSKDAENGYLGGYEASDFLWAKADGDGEGISPTASKIILTFNHIMAGVSVTLIEGEGFEPGEFAALKKSALVTNTKRQTMVNLSTGKVTAIGETPTTGTIPYKKGEEFRAIVAPQTVTANTPLFRLTVDGMPYSFSKAEDITYIPGKLHKFSIKINRKSAGGVEFQVIGESITAWESESFTHDGQTREYIVINCDTAGGLKDAITAAGKDYKKLKNLKITGNINANDFFFMRDEMTMLQAVNMKDVKIEDTKVQNTQYNNNEIPAKAFNGKSILINFVFPDIIESIGPEAFRGTNLTGSLILPLGLNRIGSSAFSDCNLDGELCLPSTLITIEAGAFRGCSKLIGQLTLPDQITLLGSSAFYGCEGFTGELKLPESLTNIGESTFYGCEGLSGDIKIPNTITTIPKSLFENCRNLNGRLHLHNNLTEICDNAFSKCSFTGELVLPESLIIIGKNVFRGGFIGASYISNMFTKLILPKSLKVIKESAFNGNNRISGIIEIPDGVTSIPSSLFQGCRNIEGIIIPKSIQSIGSEAFDGCYYMQSIICHAQTPPLVMTNTFNGVAKDNFAIEVPENSIASYSVASGWKEFKKISAHHDFSINRRLFRTLNASDVKTLILRAPNDAKWIIEDCPDWINVSPTSGIGKTEITVTIHEMLHTEAETVTYEQMNSSGNYENISFQGRRGEVVFLLEGQEYRTITTVEQYNYNPNGEIIGDGSVIQNQKATVGAGVNLVFMADCFDAKDISEGKYLNAVNEAIGYFFDIAPYKQYKDYFNVYTVVGLSSDSGVGTVNTIREAKFGSQYGLQGSGEVVPDNATCFEYACKAPTVNENNINRTLIVLIENSTEYDGICYMYGDGSAIALCPMSADAYPYDFRGIIQHEAGGHGFGKLADEYIYHNAFIQSCTCTDGCKHADEFNAMKVRGWYENLSLSGNMYDVPWSHFIFDSQYSNVVDIYEGGFFHTRGVFRSEPNSCMNNNVPYYSAISREAIVKRIMEYAGEEYSFEKFKEKDVLSVGPTETKSMIPDMSVFYPATQQHGPVFMGEKPEFKKN